MKMQVFFRYGVILLIVLLALAPSQAWAKRTITGTIFMPDGTPAKNLGVIAWDEDDWTAGNHDPMAKAVTDSQGRYTMHYRGGPWDTKVPGSTSFRPDIFLLIFAPEAGMYPVKKTGVYKNWMMSKDLRIDVTVPGILGKITGAPASGLKVKAFDDDFVSKDDPISQTTTLPDGRYCMLYPGKHYDWTPGYPGGVGAAVDVATGVPVGILLDYIISKGWNNQMHRRWTSWRPDIYIRVYTLTGGRWVQVKKSGVYKNWPHRKILRINLSLTGNSTTKATTTPKRSDVLNGDLKKGQHPK
jgi:5-hydroxyisourate hydrolase-like protein (transthyretin family)